MSIEEKITCGKLIRFNSMLVKNRLAFCIDYDCYEQVIYKGFFGLKVVDKKTFLGFARVIEIYDYLDRELSIWERKLIRALYKAGHNMDSKTVAEFVDKLFKEAHIKIFINPEDNYHNAKKD